MSDNRVEEFWAWVDAVIEERNTSFHEIEQRAGVGNATVSRRAKHRREPTETTFDALAAGLGVSKTELMRRAGRLEEHPTASASEQLCSLARALTPLQAERALRVVRAMFDHDQLGALD